MFHGVCVRACVRACMRVRMCVGVCVGAAELHGPCFISCSTSNLHKWRAVGRFFQTLTVLNKTK